MNKLIAIVLVTLVASAQLIAQSGQTYAPNPIRVGGPVEASRFIETNGFAKLNRHGFNSTNVQWRLLKTISLTNVTDVSACAFSPSNSTFWTVHNNNNGRITEWSLDGVFQRQLNWTSSQIPDAEAMSHVGGNWWAIAEEDANRIILFQITNNASSASATMDTNNARIIKIDASIAVDGVGGGGGVEGIAWDWTRQGIWVAKEKTPCQIVFCSFTGTSNYVHPAMTQITNASNNDIGDLFLDRENDILWIVQNEPTGASATNRIVGLNLTTSNVVARIQLHEMGQVEGISMTPDGFILVAGEVNVFSIYAPEPANSGIEWVRPSWSTNLPHYPSSLFVRSQTNQVTGDARISGTGFMGTAVVTNNAHVVGTANMSTGNVTNNLTVAGTASVSAAVVTNNINVGGAANVGSAVVTNSIAFIGNTVAGAGSGNSNFTFTVSMGDRDANAAGNVSVTAIMGGALGITYTTSMFFTNGSGSEKGIQFSAVTNAWHWPTNQAAPTVIPNNTALYISARTHGSNVHAAYAFYTWP